MNRYVNRKLLIIGFNLLFWITLFTLIFAIRYYESGESGFHQLKYPIPKIKIYGNGIFLGSIVGICYSFMEIYLKKKGIYKYSLLRIIINRTLLQSLVTVIVLSMIAYINFRVDVSDDLSSSTLNQFTDYIFGATIIFLFIGALLGNIVLSIYRTLQMKIGEEIFYELLTGKYKPAKEEKRAFLFLDLKSSTTIAEKLGHKKYSYFIQDCFRDLHPAVIASRAEIYQYVGDEAVLTWEYDVAIEDANCIRAFFLYEQELQKRRSYYENQYGIFPEFKGGISLGKVMTAEVGVVKRDIAYHSDVLNTAARIQGLCNEKGASLLVSETLISSLVKVADYQFIGRGEVILRGKNQRVSIFEIKKTSLD